MSESYRGNASSIADGTVVLNKINVTQPDFPNLKGWRRHEKELVKAGVGPWSGIYAVNTQITNELKRLFMSATGKNTILSALSRPHSDRPWRQHHVALQSYPDDAETRTAAGWKDIPVGELELRLTAGGEEVGREPSAWEARSKVLYGRGGDLKQVEIFLGDSFSSFFPDDYEPFSMLFINAGGAPFKECSFKKCFSRGKVDRILATGKPIEFYRRELGDHGENAGTKVDRRLAVRLSKPRSESVDAVVAEVFSAPSKRDEYARIGVLGEIPLKFATPEDVVNYIRQQMLLAQIN